MKGLVFNGPGQRAWAHVPDPVLQEDGDVIVVKMGETFEILATNSLKDQSFISSPAIAGGEIFLRSQNTLFCIR